MNLFFKVAYRNLRRHSRQSLAALLSVAVGFISLVMFEGYLEQARRLILAESRERMMFGDIVIENARTWEVDGRAEPWTARLGEAERAAIEAYLGDDPGVDAWTRTLRVAGVASNGRIQTAFISLGLDTSRTTAIRGKNWYWNTAYGVPLEQGGADGVLLGLALARRLGCRPDPPQTVRRTLEGYPPVERPLSCQSVSVQFASATPSGQVSAVDLEVVGLIDGGLKELDSRLVMMPLAQAQSLANTPDVSYYSVTLKDQGRSREFAARMRADLTGRGFDLTVLDWRDHPMMGDLYHKVTSLLDIFRNFVIVIVLCIATLSVLNTLIKIIRERTREIGSWRSLGYTRRHLVTTFTLEALLLGGTGCAIGSLLTFVVSVAINSSHLYYSGGLFTEPVPFAIAVVPFDYLAGFTILSGVSVAASLWAIRGVLRKKISENLIHT